VNAASASPVSLSHQDYGRRVARVLWGVRFLNAGVAAAKLIVGLRIGSLALLGDAAHSGIDALNTVVGLLAVSFAARAPDAGHPYGHSKIETLAAFVLSGLLFLTAGEIAITAVRRLWRGQESPEVTWLAYAVAGGTLLVNLVVSRWEAARGRALNSDFLIADAAHTQSDVLVTSAVLASLALAQLGVAGIDPILSLVIAALIGRISYQVFRRTLPVLVDASAVDEDLVQRIVGAVPGAISAHAVRSRRTAGRVFVEMHLLVEPTDTIGAHAVTEDVERALEAALGPTSATIHVETTRDCGE
jgi:cation diffusion facilitator family transporter